MKKEEDRLEIIMSHEMRLNLLEQGFTFEDLKRNVWMILKLTESGEKNE